MPPAAQRNLRSVVEVVVPHRIDAESALVLRQKSRSLLSFIFGIAAHKVSDARRRATRLSAPTTARGAAAHHVVDVEDGPEHHVLRRELRGEMGQLVETLPVRHQQILFMRVIVGMSAEQTARVLDTTPGAVRVAQHRALSHLRARIGNGPAR